MAGRKLLGSYQVLRQTTCSDLVARGLHDGLQTVVLEVPTAVLAVAHVVAIVGRKSMGTAGVKLKAGGRRR